MNVIDKTWKNLNTISKGEKKKIIKIKEIDKMKVVIKKLNKEINLVDAIKKNKNSI